MPKDISDSKLYAALTAAGFSFRDNSLEHMSGGRRSIRLAFMREQSHVSFTAMGKSNREVLKDAVKQKGAI